MRRLRWTALILLIVSIGAFGWYCRSYYKNLDTLGPSISMEEDNIQVSVQDDEKVLLAGVTAYDAKDGDVSRSMGIESISEFMQGTPTREIHIVAFDHDDHVTKATRMITYTDYTPTQFSLDGPLRFARSSGAIDILGLVHAQDCLDGDVSLQVNFEQNSTINVDTEGEYHTQLEVTNTAGDTQKLPVNITIYDSLVESASPTIILNKYLIYVRRSEEINPLDYIDHMVYHGTEYILTEDRGTFLVNTENMSSYERKEFQKQEPAVNIELFEIEDKVNYKVPGTYEIRYYLEDADGNRGTTTLIVVVGNLSDH